MTTVSLKDKIVKVVRTKSLISWHKKPFKNIVHGKSGYNFKQNVLFVIIKYVLNNINIFIYMYSYYIVI